MFRALKVSYSNRNGGKWLTLVKISCLYDFKWKVKDFCVFFEISIKLRAYSKNIHLFRKIKPQSVWNYHSPAIMWPLRSFCTPYGALNTFGSRITNFRGGAYGFLEKNDYKNFCPKVSAGRFFFGGSWDYGQHIPVEKPLLRICSQKYYILP